MTAEVIPFNVKDKEPECSFCKIKKSKAKKMIVSSNGKAICDKCLATCTSILHNEKERA